MEKQQSYVEEEQEAHHHHHHNTDSMDVDYDQEDGNDSNDDESGGDGDDDNDEIMIGGESTAAALATTTTTMLYDKENNNNAVMDEENNNNSNNTNKPMKKKAASSSDKSKKNPTTTTTTSSSSPSPTSTSSKKKQPPGPGTAGALSKTYIQLVHEALTSIEQQPPSTRKDKPTKVKGSGSIPAISKYILTNYPTLDTPHFKHRINVALKNGCKNGTFTQIRASYKVSTEYKRKEREAAKKAAKAEAAAAKKKKEQQEKHQQSNSNKTKSSSTEAASKKTAIIDIDEVEDHMNDGKKLGKSTTNTKANSTKKATAGTGGGTVKTTTNWKKKEQEEAAAAAASAAKKRRQQQRRLEQEKAEKWSKERDDIIRKRKYPMDDTQLHNEDRIWMIKTPPDVTQRPYLPYFFTMTLPLLKNKSRSGKTSSSILNASKADNLNTDSRGLVPDLLQVYHFFRGDLNITSILSTSTTTPVVHVAEFTLRHLIHSIDQIINGSTKRARQVPPLICHLFVTCLQILLQPHPSSSQQKQQEKSTSSEQLNQGLSQNDNNNNAIVSPAYDIDKIQQQFQKDLSNCLLPALCPASWSDVCHLYMDAMERFYTTDATSRDPAVLQPLPIDLDFLMKRTSEPAVLSSRATTTSSTVSPTTASFSTASASAPTSDMDMNNRQSSKVDGGNNSHGDTTSGNDGDGDDDDPIPLPDGYTGYLGHADGTLYRTHYKLGRHDPWLLTAEEIMSLLRALTDDILATNPIICDNISKRDGEISELLRKQRSTLAKFRKIRNAYEGTGSNNNSNNKKKSTNTTTMSKTTDKTTTTTTKKTPEETTKSISKTKGKNGPQGEKDDDNNDNGENDNNGGDSSDMRKDQKSLDQPKRPLKPAVSKKQFETARKELEQATDAYEKGIRRLVARTEPVGYDRHFNAVYCFRHDPDVLYVEDRRPPLGNSGSGGGLGGSNGGNNNNNNVVAGGCVSDPCVDMSWERRSWHIIETTSLFDMFTSSLDIRGRREHDLYQEMLGPPGAQNQSLRRFLYDDVKEEANKKARIKEKDVLMKKLDEARRRCDEEQGRRSGRLAGQAEEEFSRLEVEMRELDCRMNGKIQPTTTRPNQFELTGYNALEKLDSNADMMEEGRRTREKKASAFKPNYLPLMHCSVLIPSGDIDGTGLIGSMVIEMLDLEEKCESLSTWERTDMKRSTWIGRLEGAVHAWNHMNPPLLATDETLRNGKYSSSSSSKTSQDVVAIDNDDNGASSRSSSGKKRLSNDSNSSAGSSHNHPSKRRRHEGSNSSRSRTPPPSSVTSIPTILTMIRQSLLDLEDRVADMTNVIVATQDAELADDNMSTTTNDETDDDTNDDERAKKNREKVQNAWKRLIHKVRDMPSSCHAPVRETIIAAIDAARKAHLPDIVSQLRGTLLKLRLNAAYECKTAAIEILEKHGGYTPTADDDEKNDKDDDRGGGGGDEEMDIPSVVSFQAAVLISSLGGTDDATRVDWIDAVKSCKNISRMASLMSAFVRTANEKLKKLEVERKEMLSALASWEKEDERRNNTSTTNKNSKKKKNIGRPKEETVEPSEVWADVTFTDEICMAKVDKFPWWPAKVCKAKDEKMVSRLSNVHRTIVALMGEMGGLRVVKTDSGIRPFDGNLIEEEDGSGENNDLAKAARRTRTQLDECMTMARRIIRGRQKQQQKKG